MGQTLLREFPGWKAGLLVGDRELSKTIALRAVKVNILYNGPIECAFAQFLLEDRYAFRTREAPSLADSPGARMFENRLRKNRKLLAKEAAGRGHLLPDYDADMLSTRLPWISTRTAGSSCRNTRLRKRLTRSTRREGGTRRLP
jgi:23S rRNA (guanine2445-N2)-methyltransferase / 23S rRNA (guanine2069-N7)-methyltransferase